LPISVSRELKKAGEKGMKPTVVARYASLLEMYDTGLFPKPPTAPPPARTPQGSGVIYNACAVSPEFPDRPLLEMFQEILIDASLLRKQN
jgi:hypothetical protein